jgi:hypothetical protein
VAEHHFAAEVLKIRVLHPPVAQHLVGEIVHVLENEQPSHQPCRQWRLPRPGATDRTEPSRQKTPVNLRREPHQRMAKIDHLLQSGTKQIILAVVAWLAHGRPPDSESRRRRNHEPPKSGIPKRKKTATHHRLSCKIEYLLRSNHGDGSIASEFFTGD